jgi:hypothetical protein
VTTRADNITESDSSLNKSGSHTIADNITESDSSLNKSGSHAIADNITESDSSVLLRVQFRQDSVLLRVQFKQVLTDFFVGYWCLSSLSVMLSAIV